MMTGIVVLSNQLSHTVSPGEAAIETDLMHLATEQNAAVRSLGCERQIDESTLARYIGAYSSDDSRMLPVVIELRNGHLALIPNGKGASTLIARSDHEFYFKEWEGEAEFLPGPHGKWILNMFTLPDQTMVTMNQTSMISK